MSTAPASAADLVYDVPPPEAAPESDWQFAVAIYMWAAGLDGKVGMFDRPTINIDQSFGDIWKELKFAGMAVGEARKGRWAVFADLIYIKIATDSGLTGTVGNVPVKLDAKVKTETFTGTLMGEYRFLESERGTADLMAGARLWSVDTKIRAKLSADGTEVGAYSGNDGETWVDPMIGLRGRLNLDESWYLTGWGMIGGFGVASDFAWDVFGSVGYQWSRSFSTTVGYRALGVDYRDDGFVYDIVEHGPVLGAVLRF
ncbi:hypothetical protein HW532_13405 [Kaustia mangrovi]|uniref:Outer membrane protein beta-barrel domain-containing protein n=2 Tax=Kaustia mangrovi TaxID=2593653 RepID=A0A7S8C8J3_9HYPH|nr:hypothetical protein HW532_13405 [Kaustia mangrovi]